MHHFKYDNYQRTDTKLLRAYGENMFAYLSRLHPTIDSDKIRAFISEEVKTTLQRPQMTMVDYPSYGNANLASVDLLSYTDTMRQNIVTPAGVLYMPATQRESFLRRKLNRNSAARAVQKKAMFLAASVGDLVGEQRGNNLQGFIKIENNSIPGAFGSPHNCLFDVPGYNAVTAVGRHCIMSGYAHVEKLVEGNYYFPTVDHCINYCIQMLRVMPTTVGDVMTKYQLYAPTAQDLFDHFADSLRLYMPMKPIVHDVLMTFFAMLNADERNFIYYVYCLKTLLTKNAVLFRGFFTEFFRTDLAADPTSEPSAIFRFNSDLLAMASALNADIIERMPVGDAVKQCPDGVRQLIAICHHMESKLDGIGDLLATFLRADCDVPDAMQHKNMIRKAVIISDTDSVIFSTQSWIEWFTGGTSFERAAYEINSIVVFFMARTLEQVFARLSTNMGVQKEDINKIVMKNEFLYPLMLRTPLPKQYAGRIAIQEGFVLPKTKEDIKGLSFRSSTLCRETTTAGTAFVNWLFDGVMQNGTIKASDCIAKALQHEKRVLRSLESGERTFLTTVPIRQQDDYKNPAISVYYYWQLWNAVFKPYFGEFIIPSKGYDIPVMGDGAVLKDERYLDRLRIFDKGLYTRLCAFMEANTRTITRLVIPRTLKRVPEIIRPLIDTRGIVYSNAIPFIVTLRSLGIGYTASKDQTLLSDIYD